MGFLDDIAKTLQQVSRTIGQTITLGGLTDFAGYRLVLALSDGILNQHLSKKFRGSRPEIVGLPWKLTSKDQTWEITITELGTPRLDFDTKVKNGCRLKIPISKGTLRYIAVVDWDGTEEAQLKTLAMDDVTLTAIVDVSKIQHTGWAPQDMDSAAIFADLSAIVSTEIDISDDIRIAAGDLIEKELATLLFDELKARGNAHLLQSLFKGLCPHGMPGHAAGSPAYRPYGYTYSTTIVRSGNRYLYGILNVLFLTEGKKSFPQGNTAGEIDSPLTGANEGHLVLSGATILDHFGRYEAKKRWDGVPLLLRRNRVGRGAPKLYLEKKWNFGVVVSGRGRNAYMGKLDGTLKPGEFHLKGYYDTSRYRVFKDSKFRAHVSASVSIPRWKFDLPGREVFDFANHEFDDHLKVKVLFR